MTKLVFLLDCSCFKFFQGSASVMIGIIDNLKECNRKIKLAQEIEIHLAYDEIDPRIILKEKKIIYHKINSNLLVRNFISLPKLSYKINANIIISTYTIPFFAKGEKICFMHDILFIKYPKYFSLKYITSRYLLFYISAKLCNHLYTISNFSKSCIQSSFKINPKKISVIKLGANYRENNKTIIRKVNKKNFKLLYVANFEDIRKRHYYAMRLFEELTKEGFDLKLTFVGSGRSINAIKLKKQLNIFQLKYPNTFNYFSNISEKSLTDLYRDTDIFLFPSFAEGYGIPVIEAAMEGIPCVVSNGSSLDELKDYYVGSSFKRESYDSFKKTFKKIIKNYDEYKFKAAKNVDNIKKILSWSYQIEEFLRLLKKNIKQ